MSVLIFVRVPAMELPGLLGRYSKIFRRVRLDEKGVGNRNKQRNNKRKHIIDVNGR